MSKSRMHTCTIWSVHLKNALLIHLIGIFMFGRHGTILQLKFWSLVRVWFLSWGAERVAIHRPMGRYRRRVDRPLLEFGRRLKYILAIFRRLERRRARCRARCWVENTVIVDWVILQSLTRNGHIFVSKLQAFLERRIEVLQLCRYLFLCLTCQISYLLLNE